MKLMYALFFLDSLCFSLVLPVFGPHVRGLGATHLFLGLMGSSVALISLLWNPVIGSLSDTKGRKHILMYCMLSGAFGNLLICLNSSLKAIFLARLITAFTSPVVILLRTIVTDVTKNDEEKNAMFGKVGIITAGAFILGSLISGFISEANNGVSIVFGLISTIYMINISLASRLPNDEKTAKENSNASFLTRASNELKQAALNFKNLNWSKYWPIFAIKGLSDFCMGIISSNMGLVIATDYQLKGRSIGYMFMLLTVVSMIANVLKLRLRKHLPSSAYLQLIYNGVVLLFTYLGFGFIKPLYLFLFCLSLMSISKSLVDSVLTETITSCTSKEDKGKVISAFDNLMSLAMFVTPITSGVVADIIGVRNTMALNTVPMAAFLAIAYDQYSREKREKTRTD